MSTIASPRETSVNGRRVPQINQTPTSSSRPSSEQPRSSDASPNRASLSLSQPPTKRNRAALREYYNLKASSALAEKENDASSITSGNHDQSEVLESEIDQPGFNAEAYVKQVLENQNLEELLRTYNGVLTDIRALDAEKKALVYDNYSKLIAATETIRKMRDNMDPLNPMASTLDPAINSVYERADRIKEELKDGMPEWQRKEMELGKEEREKLEKRRAASKVAQRVLETPEKIRALVKKGQEEEAKNLWESTLVVLERWKERGVGGPDVQDCIDDGEAALRGEEPTEKSWAKLKASKQSKS